MHVLKMLSPFGVITLWLSYLLSETQDEVGTMKHNWSARCQHNVTGWVSMWACDMLSQ